MTDIEDAIHDRRTHKVYGGGAISRETLVALIESAIWAPNHRFTEPWRFYVVHGAEKLAAMNGHVQRALDAAVKGVDAGGSRKLASKKQKMTIRLETAAAVIVVTWQRTHDDPSLDREDYAATACAIQNLLLAAHSRGYGSLWSTGKMLMRPALLEFYGIDPAATAEDVVGVIFLGTPVTALAGRRQRSATSVTSWA